MQLNLSDISYTYPGAAEPAIEAVCATFPQGWTGVVGDNGCGKTTFARIACGLLEPVSGAVTPKLFAIYCEQDSSVAPEALYDFACDWGSEAQAVRRLLRIEDAWLWRYESLSGGQRKRIQIACALWARPDVLAVDEPTNDLDVETRTAVTRALRSFSGIGILISHDRELLDSLCTQCFMHDGAGGFIMRPGGYSQAVEQARMDRESAFRRRDNAKREMRRLEAEVARRRSEADRSAARRSARRLDKHDSDARERLGRAIVSGKDGVAARNSAVMGARLARAQAALEGAKIEKRYAATLSEYGCASKASSVAHLSAGVLQAGEFRLQVPELWVGPTDHAVLVGSNGSGKSLLAKHIFESVPESVEAAYIPQEVGLGERTRALRKLRALTQKDQGRVLSVVAGLNSSPERLLDGEDVSPGEMKKLMLAQHLVEDPQFLILDEPTNHLDIGSIEAIAGLLAGFPGAFLLVTHDAYLKDALQRISWETLPAGESECMLKIW